MLLSHRSNEKGLILVGGQRDTTRFVTQAHRGDRGREIRGEFLNVSMVGRKRDEGERRLN